MPLTFRGSGATASTVRRAVTGCDFLWCAYHAIAILGFADVGCQGGAAALLDSFNSGL